MRLREKDVSSIKAAAGETFGPDATVRLFGSRLDDTQRGGDIDLYVEAGELARDGRLRASFAVELQRRLGERAIDIVYAATGPQRRIDEVARSDGLIL